MNTLFQYFISNYNLIYRIENINIGYGLSGKEDVLIRKNVPDTFLSEKRDIDPGQVVWKSWKGTSIPFLFDRSDAYEIISLVNGKVFINYDIVGSSFYFLSGWNEYVTKERDELGRFSYDSSIINTLGISGIPAVNYYFDILDYAVSLLTGDEKQNSRKANHFSVSLSHDIDECLSGWLAGAKSELRKGKLHSIPALFFNRLFKNDDWFNFEMISGIEKKYDAQSTYYFLPQKGKWGRYQNADYDIEHPDIQAEILNLRQLGHEIGIHGSFGTHIDPDKLDSDIDKIGISSVEGNRFHYLMFDVEKSVETLKKCGILYDATLGFAEQIGFRRGSCTPFYLYDFNSGTTSPVLELPLHVMDRTLQKYMRLKPEESFEKIRPLIDETIKFDGTFTVLWHNMFFSEYAYKGWKEVYLEILKYCQENKGTFDTARNIVTSLLAPS